MALFQMASEVKGECEGEVLGKVQFNQPGCHYTGPGYPTYLHLLTLLTVLATFVSRQLLNPNSHPHQPTYINSFALS